MFKSPDVAEGLIRLNLQPGSVFHFPYEFFTTDAPHFFIVLNEQPLTDPELVLVHATSKVENARRHCGMYPDTLVELTPGDYPEFTAPISAINCGLVTTVTVRELAEKLRRDQLRLCSPVDRAILQRLRTALRASPTVERRHKRIVGVAT
jgi:hypothetical protein